MGALTFKNFPFELRGWDLQKFEQIDLTDAFGTSIKILINGKQIIQIESNPTHQNWIHDKCRQFFDCLTPNNVNTNFNNLLYKTTKTLYKTIYLFEICNLKHLNVNYFLIIYENVSINLLCLLSIYSQKYSFIKLKKIEKISINNNLEQTFLLQNLKNKKISNSTFCLIISSNIRLEGSLLNLNLKQKILKGNFKCFIIGAFINLTFNINFLGKTTIKILKTISTGKNFICQDFKTAKNPIIIINSNLLKRNDSLTITILLNYLANLDRKISINTLNLSIFEPGIYYLNKPKILNNLDIQQFSSIYFINLNIFGSQNLNKIFKTNLFYLNQYAATYIKKTCLNNNFNNNSNLIELFLNKKLDKYLYLPVKTSFETKEIFLNTFGLLKQTNELILTPTQRKSSWTTIRYIFNGLKKHLKFLNLKNNTLILNQEIKNKNLNNFINLHFKVLQNFNENNITNVKCFNTKNNNFILKMKSFKFFNTKIKFWLNDFFTGGKDGISKNSLTLIKLAKIGQKQNTNFF